MPKVIIYLFIHKLLPINTDIYFFEPLNTTNIYFFFSSIIWRGEDPLLSSLLGILDWQEIWTPKSLSWRVPGPIWTLSSGPARELEGLYVLGPPPSYFWINLALTMIASFINSLFEITWSYGLPQYTSLVAPSKKFRKFSRVSILMSSTRTGDIYSYVGTGMLTSRTSPRKSLNICLHFVNNLD